jgi:hypothetical protein
MKKEILPALLILLLFTSCSDKVTSPTEADGPGSSLTARFSSIQENIFSGNCARSGCHSGPDPQEGLNLESGNAYSNLVGVTSSQSSLLRVKPGSSDESWLVKKLTGDGTSVMPPSGMLLRANIDTIAAWIDQGALNN